VAFMTKPVTTVEIDFPGTGTWSDVTGYVSHGEITMTRGRQDQHQTVQGGSCSFILDNPDGRFSAGNASSPYYPNVKLNRPLRIRHAYVPGKNYIVNPTLETDSSWWLWPNGNTAPASGVSALWSATRAQQGTHSIELRNNSGGALDLSLVTEFGGLTIGATYTASAWIYQTAGTTKLGVVGTGYGTATAATGAFTQITFTFTATQRCHTLIVTAVALANTTSIWFDTIQVEDGSSASAFDGANPASLWGRFQGTTGGSWPIQWTGDPGLWSEVPVTGVDVFTRLGRYKCRSALAEQLKFSMAPQAYWPLADASGSTSALQLGSDTTIGPLVIGQDGQPTGSVAFASGSGPPYGDSSVLAFKDNSANQLNHYWLECKGIPKPIDGSNGLTVGFWFATDTSPTTTGEMILVAAYGVAGDWIRIKLTSASLLVAERLAASGNPIYQLSFGPFADFTANKVIQVSLSEVWNGSSFDVTLQLGSTPSTTQAAATTIPFRIRSMFVGGHQPGLGAREGYSGSVSNVYFTTTASSDFTSNGPIDAVGQAALGGLVAGNNNRQGIPALLDFLDPTIQRFLLVNPGGTGYQLAGQSLLIAAQAYAAVRQTPLFVDGFGIVTYYDRSTWYNQTGQGLRELDAGQYTAVAPVLDDTLLANDVTVTRPNGAGGYAHNEASKATYGVYDASLQVPAFSPQAAQNIADHLVNVYSEPAVRVPQVTVDVLTQWSAVGQKILDADVAYNLYLKNLPSQAPATNLDLFVEGLTETISVDSWQITFNCSLASLARTWQLDVSPYSQLDSINRIAW
jgi:hypothetical protein